MTNLPGSFLLSRAVLVCIGVLSATIATAELRKSIELSSVSVLADRLRQKPGMELPPLERVASRVELDGSLPSCRSDSLADLLTVHLRHLDRLDQTENYDEWAEGIERATQFVEAAISCSPADGNLWARLAMLRQAAVPVPEQTAQLMAQSVRLSPAQINVILARFEVWRRMDAAALALADAGLRSDLRNTLAHANGTDLQHIQSKLNTPLSQMAYEESKSLSKERVAHITALRLNSVFSEVN